MTSAKGRKIQQLREVQNLSVDELSHRMGVHAETVRRREAGEEEIGEAPLSQLATTLGASQDELRHEGDAQHHDGHEH